MGERVHSVQHLRYEIAIGSKYRFNKEMRFQLVFGVVPVPGRIDARLNVQYVRKAGSHYPHAHFLQRPTCVLHF